MIVELVTFTLPAGWDRERVLADARTTVPRWSAEPELFRKHFLRGIGEADGTAAGLYIWPSVEAARKAHDEAWREGIRRRTGSDPAIRYFDLLMLIDNEEGTVTEWTAEGEAREPARA
jgi:hypothetical protein